MPSLLALLLATSRPPTASVGLTLLDLSSGDPITPLIDIPGTTTLWVTSAGQWLAGVFPQWCLAILGGMTRIGAMSVAVILYFPPFALLGCIAGCCWWTSN